MHKSLLHRTILLILLISISLTGCTLNKMPPTQHIQITPQKTESFNLISQELIQIDKTTGAHFCFETNKFIDGTKISEIINYTKIQFNHNLKFTGPDVTFNHNLEQPTQYVCYNSIDSTEGISCWNNIVNPIFPTPECVTLLDNSTISKISQ